MEKHWLINKRNAIFGIIIALFILSECCTPLSFLDALHIKHFVLLLAVLGYFLQNARTIIRNFKASFEFKNIVLLIFGLLLISLVLQVMHGHFEFFTLVEIYYLAIPIVFVELFYFQHENQDIEGVLTFALYILLISYFVTSYSNGKLSVSNLISMLDFRSLFIDSTSAIGEIGLVSSCCTLLEIFFIYKNKKKKAILSFIGVFLGYKRFCVFFAALILIIGLVVPNIKLNKKVLYITIALFIFMPFATQLMCSNSFASWFYRMTGIDFNYFTKTRFSIINTVIDANLTSYGLGTVTHYLETRNVFRQTNMHNDLLMIYLDCTIIGTGIFTVQLFKIASNSIYAYYMMVFLFGQMFITHCLGKGTIIVWLLSYMIIYYFNRNMDIDGMCERIGEEVENRYSNIS